MSFSGVSVLGLVGVVAGFFVCGRMFQFVVDVCGRWQSVGVVTVPGCCWDDLC